jgi:ATP-binding cassette, subfamily B, bacterial
MTTNSKKQSTSRARDVLKVFWEGMKGYRLGFFVTCLMLIVTNALQTIIPIYYKRFFDVLTDATDRQSASASLIHILLIILGINVLIWIAYRGATFIQNYAQIRTIAKLKQNAFDYMTGHSYTFFANNFTGSLTQRVNRFARAFDRLMDRLVWSIIPIVVMIIGVIIVLWNVSIVIAFVIVGVAVFFLIFNYFFSLWKLKYDLKNAAADSETTGLLSDDITNHSAIQLFTARGKESKNFRDSTNEQARLSILTWNLAGIVDMIRGVVLITAEFFLFYFAIQMWLRGEITIGTFVLIQAYFIGLGSRLWDLSRIIRDIYEGFADAKEMVDILLEPHEIKDSPLATELKVAEGKIEYKDILFGYNQDRKVLNNINVIINPGEKVALIGPSGAGKSTFVRLLLRFYDPTGGAILIDGQDIKQATQDSLRENVSLVPQDPILFHRTLKENIGYGKKSATDEEIMQAAKLAHADDFIKNLPLGYETYVGERGIKLSGGERQRVAIARAILKNAPILILDEATSSLDSESEHLIQDALDTLMKDKTVIVIAHRLSTIRKMDRIIVVDNGQILEEGTHAELLEKQNSLYKKLWSLQAGGFIPEEQEGGTVA